MDRYPISTDLIPHQEPFSMRHIVQNPRALSCDSFTGNCHKLHVVSFQTITETLDTEEFARL